MKNITFLTFLFVLATISSSAVASDGNCDNNYLTGYGFRSCNNVNITSVLVHDGGNIKIETSADETQLGCTPDSGKYLTLSGDAEGTKSMYAIVLQAIAMGKKMSFRIATDAPAGCVVQYLICEN